MGCRGGKKKTYKRQRELNGMMEDGQRRLAELLETAAGDDDVMAVILYGSSARGERARDVDICLVLYPGKTADAFEKRMMYSRHEKLDVQVFRQLPLYIQRRVLTEGQMLLCKNEDLLYDIAFDAIRTFEYYRPRYEEYLEGVLNE